MRGKEQSRYPNAIKSEIQKLADDNFKEITLLGQNIDAYGRDLPGTTKEGRKENTLTDLLYYIHDVKGIRRIRFATSHPRYFSKRLKLVMNLKKSVNISIFPSKVEMMKS